MADIANDLDEHGSAVGEGFEPPVPCGTPVFKTGAFDHSATRPKKTQGPNSKDPWRPTACRP